MQGEVMARLEGEKKKTTHISLRSAQYISSPSYTATYKFCVPVPIIKLYAIQNITYSYVNYSYSKKKERKKKKLNKKKN